jgi:hypothetical protein
MFFINSNLALTMIHLSNLRNWTEVYENKVNHLLSLLDFWMSIIGVLP